MALHERYLEKVVPNTYGTTLTCCFCLGCERRTALSSTGGGGRGGRSGGSSYHSISQSVDMDSPPLLSNMEEGAANMSGGDGGKGGGGKRRVVVAAKGAVEEVNAAVQVRREGHWPYVCVLLRCVCSVGCTVCIVCLLAVFTHMHIHDTNGFEIATLPWYMVTSL